MSPPTSAIDSRFKPGQGQPLGQDLHRHVEPEVIGEPVPTDDHRSVLSVAIVSSALVPRPASARPDQIDRNARQDDQETDPRSPGLQVDEVEHQQDRQADVDQDGQRVADRPIRAAQVAVP